MFCFGFVLVSFFFEHIISVCPPNVVVEEIRWIVPRMRCWVALMSWYGKGSVKVIYKMRYMAAWKRQISAIDLYPYQGMDFKGEIDLPVPLPA